LASADIEGNTLSDDQARQLVTNQLTLPPAQRHLQQGVKNVVEAMQAIAVSAHQPFTLTEQWIKEQNCLVLRDLELPENVVPGEYTTAQFTAGAFKSAPPQDVAYLVGRLVDGLNDVLRESVQRPGNSEAQRFFWSFFAAALGHLYITWIHPFGDGNGRTARLVEYALLAHSGVVPTISAGLLANHYYKTRQIYYGELVGASRRHDGVTGFIRYAAEGFVDMLREQIEQIRTLQRRIAWESYVYGVFEDENQVAMTDRRRRVALALPEDGWLTYKQIQALTPQLAQLYAAVGQRTCARDMDDLVSRGLVRKQKATFSSAVGIIDVFRAA